MRSLSYVFALTVIWVLLWGSASAANVLSGIAIGAALVVLVPGLRRSSAGRYALRPLAILRLVGHMLVVTLRSNVELTREVLSRQSRLRTAIVGVPLPGCSDELLTLMSNLLALSPGTMPIELRHDPLVLYVHVLYRSDVEQVRGDIVRLTDLTVRAFGSADSASYQAASARSQGSP